MDDDKPMIVICATVVMLFAIGTMGIEALPTLTAYLTGLFGIAVGRATK